MTTIIIFMFGIAIGYMYRTGMDWYRGTLTDEDALLEWYREMNKRKEE